MYYSPVQNVLEQSTARNTTNLSVTDAIKTRVSIRKFVQEPMNQDDLREILELASDASC